MKLKERQNKNRTKNKNRKEKKREREKRITLLCNILESSTTTGQKIQDMASSCETPIDFRTNVEDSVEQRYGGITLTLTCVGTGRSGVGAILSLLQAEFDGFSQA